MVIYTYLNKREEEMMKKTKQIVVMATVVVTMILFISTAQANALTLRFAHVAVAGHMYQVGEKLIENIEELSGGEIKVQHFPASQLGNLPQMLGQLRKGTVDLFKSDYGLIMIAKGGKPFIVGFSPYLYRDQAHFEKFVASALFKEMMGAVEKENGIKWIGLLGNRTPRALTTRHKMVLVPDDIKGIKIRVPKVSGIPESFEGWGASIGVVTAAEMYNALKQKVVDGQENGIEVVVDFKLYEVQKYYTAIDYVRSSEGLWMNTEKWNSLSSAHKEVIVNATKLTRVRANQSLREKMLEWFDFCRDKGMTIVMPPMKPWIEASRKVIQELDGKVWPKGLYAKIQSIK